MKHDHYTRILSLEVRYQRFGFVVLEVNPKRLLDSGVRTFASAAGILKRLEPIVSIFDPDVIIVRCPGQRSLHHRNGVLSFIQIIRIESARQLIPMESMTLDEVKCVFRASGRTKEHIAATIAQMFPELHWKLPPKRKPWISEGYNMVIFDATATGLAYMARFDPKTESP